MKIKLNQLTLRNFKGVQFFNLDTEGKDDITISGENGIGKTTVYDGFMWLFFDKDSHNKKSFGLRPLDHNNQPIKGLTVSVEAALDVDGMTHRIRKEQQEKYAQKQVSGFTNLCWVDDVPKKLSEFKEFIDTLVSEEDFRLLTDLSYFNGKMHWEKRRQVLLDIAGTVSSPTGFTNLQALMAGRSVKDFKKVLVEQKKKLTNERDQINPRIDELRRSTPDTLVAPEVTTAERDALKSVDKDLQNDLAKLLSQEQQRQQQLEKILHLKSERVVREAELKSDTSGTKALQEEKWQLEQSVIAAENAEKAAAAKVNSQKALILAKQNEIDTLNETLKSIRDEYQQLEKKKPESKCYACGQDLPFDKIQENEQKLTAQKSNIELRGTKAKELLNEQKIQLEDLKKAEGDMISEYLKAKEEAAQASQKAGLRIHEIDELIANRKTTPPEEDGKWKDLTDEIENLEAEIGEPVSQQIKEIRIKEKMIYEQIAQLNNTLAQYDRAKQDMARIIELEQREKDLSQQITNIEGQLKEIESYNAEQSKLIESAVNGKFKHITFKLFKKLLNESLEDCCVALLDGVPYDDMSAGQRIIAGVDVINTLSEHQDMSVPMFIDHYESLTLPLETKAQTIKLKAVKGNKKLHVS